MTEQENRRILLVDDTPSIHEDFKKILNVTSMQQAPGKLSDAKALFMGAGAASEGASGNTQTPDYEIDSAYQGQEALEKVKAALAKDQPYAMAFVDVRMPPGWDGIETISHLWEEDPELQVVICTAFSDYSWDQTIGKLGQSANLLILKKPFDSVEICQLAAALTQKWNTVRRERALVADLTRAEQEARAYASSLVTVNRALETSKAAADKSSEMKTEFLVHLSGEIHKNLEHILQQADLLKTPAKVDGGQMELLDLVLSASHRLTLSLDQILDITMIESGRMELDQEYCSPVEMVEQVIATYLPIAEDKGITLTHEVTASIPEQIQTDRIRFMQVLSNLVENGVRHTDSGSVRVLLSTEQTDDWKRPLLRCDVVDTGPGIAAQHHGNLFEPFYRVDPNEPGGAGLGLALAKRIARLLSADVVVESMPGRGTTFSFTVETGNLSGVKMTS